MGGVRSNVARLILTSAGCSKSLEFFVPEDTASIITITYRNKKEN